MTTTAWMIVWALLGSLALTSLTVGGRRRVMSDSDERARILVKLILNESLWHAKIELDKSRQLHTDGDP